MTPDAPVFWFDEIDSTNEEARRLAMAGNLGPLWIGAPSQSNGRGRLGRRWVSTDGNLFTTALYAEPGGLDIASRTAFAAGLAVLDACQALVPDVAFKLKWPNDVRVEGAKLCGILVESGRHDGTLWVAAGLGVNVKHAPEGTGQATQSLAGLGLAEDMSARAVLEAIRPRFAARIDQARGDFQSLLRDWEAVGEGRDELVAAGPETDRVQGRFEGLSETGGLILRLPDGQTRTINAGDVEILRHVG
ncbi:MAG: biotin--[acetyl-CoA-carboxylase] ligase [Pseudomonadota bacterium]